MQTKMCSSNVRYSLRHYVYVVAAVFHIEIHITNLVQRTHGTVHLNTFVYSVCIHAPVCILPEKCVSSSMITAPVQQMLHHSMLKIAAGISLGVDHLLHKNTW